LRRSQKDSKMSDYENIDFRSVGFSVILVYFQTSSLLVKKQAQESGGIDCSKRLLIYAWTMVPEASGTACVVVCLLVYFARSKFGFLVHGVGYHSFKSRSGIDLNPAR
jgi:hypothetical protein